LKNIGPAYELHCRGKIATYIFSVTHLRVASSAEFVDSCICSDLEVSFWAFVGKIKARIMAGCFSLGKNHKSYLNFRKQNALRRPPLK